MTKVDGSTMHYGLEARSPFLDQDLWEFASSLPYTLRLHRWQLKSILREVARRRINPHLAQGRKRGFGIPVHRWIVGPWRPLVEESLRESILEKEGWDPTPILIGIVPIRIKAGRGVSPIVVRAGS